MKLWKDNRVDSEYELEVDQIIERFLGSKWADLEQYPWPLQRRVPIFIGVPEDEGGLSSVIDQADYPILYDAIVDEITRRRS